MKLTYEVHGNGYTIFNDGKAWIVQDAFIPHPANTLEESVQLHINEILTANQGETTVPVQEQINELMLAVAELASANETDKMETQLAIAELASIMTGGIE